MIRHLWLFVASELIFSATPGPAAMLVSAFGFRGGFRGAMAACLGIQTGNAIYVLVSALGLGALIAASGTAFAIIKMVGAAYLIGLGGWILWKSRATQPDAPVTRGKPFAQALLTQLGNPKAVLFFGAFLPQFLNRDAPLWRQYALMFAIIMVGETLILGFYGWLGSQGRRIASFARWRERVSGAVLIAIGAIFAVSRRA
jgi:threonine/homoserine/homoserine lactone efflux protein